MDKRTFVVCETRKVIYKYIVHAPDAETAAQAVNEKLCPREAWDEDFVDSEIEVIDAGDEGIDTSKSFPQWEAELSGNNVRVIQKIKGFDD